MSNNRNPIIVVFMVVFIVIVVAPSPKFDLSHCLWEAEWYPCVDQQHVILVIVVLPLRPPSAEMMLILPIFPTNPL